MEENISIKKLMGFKFRICIIIALTFSLTHTFSLAHMSSPARSAHSSIPPAMLASDTSRGASAAPPPHSHASGGGVRKNPAPSPSSTRMSWSEECEDQPQTRVSNHPPALRSRGGAVVHAGEKRVPSAASAASGQAPSPHVSLPPPPSPSHPPALRSRGGGVVHAGEKRVPSAASAASGQAPSPRVSLPPPPSPSPPPHSVRFESDEVIEIFPADAVDDDSEEQKSRDFQEVLGLLVQHDLENFRQLFIALNSLFVLLPLLEGAGFTAIEIRRFYKLIVKVHAPKPPRGAAAGCPRRSQTTFKGTIPQGSTSRLEIIMSILMRYGVRNFVFNAKALMKGIILASGNPIVASMVANAIHQAENLSDLDTKRMLLFLLALASGVSVDSCMVKEPEHLADLFTLVIEHYRTDASGKPIFRREDVLPDNKFSKEFAVATWPFLLYVSDRFGRVPMVVEGAADASPSASEDPYKGFADELADAKSITSLASDMLDRDSVPEGVLRDSFDRYKSAILHVAADQSSIMGLETPDSRRFLLLSLLTLGVRSKASEQFKLFCKLLSIIKNVGAGRFNFFHAKSADFRSMLCCLVRFSIPQCDLVTGKFAADLFLSDCFAKDFRSMKPGMNLQSCMVKLYGLFRQELHDDKRRCLDASFADLFPHAKFPEIAAVPQPHTVVAAAVHSSPAAAGGGGNAVLSFADLTPDQLAQTLSGCSKKQLEEIAATLAALRQQ